MLICPISNCVYVNLSYFEFCIHGSSKAKYSYWQFNCFLVTNCTPGLTIPRLLLQSDDHLWRPRGRQSGWETRKARQKFSSTGGRTPGYRLSPDHFQTVKRMLVPYWAQKVLYYCARSAISSSWVLFVRSYPTAIDSTILSRLVHQGCAYKGNFHFLLS